MIGSVCLNWVDGLPMKRKCGQVYHFFGKKRHNKLVNKRYNLAVAHFAKTGYKPVSSQNANWNLC